MNTGIITIISLKYFYRDKAVAVLARGRGAVAPPPQTVFPGFSKLICVTS